MSSADPILLATTEGHDVFLGQTFEGHRIFLRDRPSSGILETFPPTREGLIEACFHVLRVEESHEDDADEVDPHEAFATEVFRMENAARGRRDWTLRSLADQIARAEAQGFLPFLAK